LDAIAQAHPGKRIEPWFEDEARFGSTFGVTTGQIVAMRIMMICDWLPVMLGKLFVLILSLCTVYLGTLISSALINYDWYKKAAATNEAQNATETATNPKEAKLMEMK